MELAGLHEGVAAGGGIYHQVAGVGGGGVLLADGAAYFRELLHEVVAGVQSACGVANHVVKAVVEGFKDSNIQLIESHLWNVYLGGDGTHPDKETHKKIAEKLANEINTIMTATPEPEITPEPTLPSGGSNKKLGWVLPVILTSVVLIGGGIGAFAIIKKKKK